MASNEGKGMQALVQIAGSIKPNETAAVYEIWANSLWVMCESYGRGVCSLYKRLGLTPPAKVKKDVVQNRESRKISLEELPLYAADHMFVHVFKPAGGAERAKKLMQSDIWRGLPAAQNNRVYMIDSSIVHSSGVIFSEKRLDHQMDVLVSRFRNEYHC